MATLTFTILGCGSSGGVPRLPNIWGACDPSNPMNRRRRCSLLVERKEQAGVTRVLIDTTPDMREQLLDAQVGELDAVVWTHEHADHVHGIDDLRQIVHNMRRLLPVWADPRTQEVLRQRFGYTFETPPGSAYPPILKMNTLTGPVEVRGAGGPIRLIPFEADHGGTIALGFRIADLAYLPDAVVIPEESWRVLEGLDLWIVDALRYKPHPSHAHLALTLEWIARARPRRAVLTNMHIDIDHDQVAREIPDHVVPAHDGMTISYEV